MMGYYILIGAIALLSWAVSARLKSKFRHYSKVHLQNGMSGAEIAEQMLRDHGIQDVKVVSAFALRAAVAELKRGCRRCGCSRMRSCSPACPGV